MTAHAEIAANQENDLRQLCHALQENLELLLPAGQPSDRVRAAMRAGTLPSGKRIRPLLLLLAARDMGYDLTKRGILDLACAVEMVHAASLILDDIPCMDDALMRRGRPTVHREFGENVAILAAVALLSRAYEVIALAPDLPSQHKTDAIAELSAAVGLQGLVQGQFQDLHEGGQRRRELHVVRDRARPRGKQRRVGGLHVHGRRSRVRHTRGHPMQRESDLDAGALTQLADRVRERLPVRIRLRAM